MQFIFGSELPSKVISLVNTSQKLLLLVSPYFDPWNHLTAGILDAVAVRGVNTKLVVRGGIDRDKQEPATAKFRQAGVQVHFLERLHAKLYMNEGEAVVTSMNLLSSSMKDSWEIGVRITEAEDREQFAALGDCVKMLLELVKNEETRLRVLAGRGDKAFDPFMALGQAGAALSIESSSRGRETGREKGEKPSKAGAAAPTTTATPAKGFCIRCGEDAKFSLAMPFCEKHTKVWEKKPDPKQAEYYCHECGERNKTTKASPICESCAAGAGT